MHPQLAIEEGSVKMIAGSEIDAIYHMCNIHNY